MEGKGPLAEFERLLSSAKAGDEAAFAELFRAVQPLLLRFLRTLGGPLAEDCAAETWLQVVRDLDRFRGDESGFRAWVFTVGRRRVVDAQRRSGRGNALAGALESGAGHEASPDTAATFDEREDTRRAMSLLAQLPAEQREAVFLRHVAGLDVKRAAKVLGRSAGSVRVAAHRGLKRLQELLADEPRDEL